MCAKPRGELTVGETPVSVGFSASDTEYPSPGDLSVSASETRGWPGNSDCGEDWIRGGSGLLVFCERGLDRTVPDVRGVEAQLVKT